MKNSFQRDKSFYTVEHISLLSQFFLKGQEYFSIVLEEFYIIGNNKTIGHCNRLILLGFYLSHLKMCDLQEVELASGMLLL